jgi:N-acetylated-alpha-linked acidic dipeptidase
MRRQVAAAVLAMAALAPGVSSQEVGLRGFARDEVGAQRDRETTFRKTPAAENLREYMKAITAEPHHAGSAGSRKVAEYILAKYRAWGLDASIEEFEALMPVPTERLVELVEPERYRATLREPAVPDDPDSGDAGQLPTYNAYAADGDVTAGLVYVNYGTPEDYEQLEKLAIDVKGRIVIARYGRSWRGIKPKVAAEHGALACIIYSDPRDDGYFQGDVYPVGPLRPEHGAQRGSVMDMPLYPGDPLSPGWASERGARRLTREQARTLVKIPVLPISYGDALPLLRSLKGPVAKGVLRLADATAVQRHRAHPGLHLPGRVGPSRQPPRRMGQWRRGPDERQRHADGGRPRVRRAPQTGMETETNHHPGLLGR